MRVALIASARFPIREPFAGGLEAHTWALAKGLQRRGHEVTVFAAAGCDPRLGARELITAPARISAGARADVSMPARRSLEEHHAYLQLMIDLAEKDGAACDIVHNNSLHYLPIAMARLLRVPMISTLHTPPTPWLESAVQTGPCPVIFTAVSSHTALAWRHAIPRVQVISNGIDLALWRPGPGGGPVVWSGRIVPEKGPDLAILAAREAGLPLDLAGPVLDWDYFAASVQPLLGGAVRYLGHLRHDELAARLGRASACLLTPRWDEPYCLAAAEALACGTPVAGFARGALPDLLDECCAVLVRPDDVAKLAEGLHAAVRLSRADARAHAVEHCPADRMIAQYESLYREAAA